MSAKKPVFWYAYVYIDPRDGTPFYIGKGIRRRAWAHLKPSAPNIILRNKITQLRLLGLEPIIEILPAADEQESFAFEKFLIEHCGRRDLGTGPLLNYTNGGEGSGGRRGMRHSEETKRHLSIVLKGRPKSEETKLLIGRANKGRPGPSEETRRKGVETLRKPENRKKMSDKIKSIMDPAHMARMTELAAIKNRKKF